MAVSGSLRLDSVAVSLMWERLVAVADEATITQMRTAFSSVVRESGDFAVSIMDRGGGALASAHVGLPSFVSTQAVTLRHALERYPIAELSEGDVLITNDPWIATGQLMDITLLSPIFHRGDVVAFGGSVAHSPDLGGSLRSVYAMDVYEEGLFIPLTKLLDGGTRNEDVFALLNANCRDASRTLGDLEAQLSALKVVNDRLLELMDEHDLPDLDAVASEIYARSESSMRDAIAALPDGTYTAEVEIDNLLPSPVVRAVDRSGDPQRICVAIEIEDGSVTVDFAGSSPQLENSTNSVWSFTAAYAAYALRLMLVPFLPNNAGFLRPIVVRCPTGSNVAADYPAATNNRHMVGHQVCDVIFTAMAEAAPALVLAPGGSAPLWMLFMAGEDRSGRPFSRWLPMNGGLGAFPAKDGEIATFPANLRNTPFEIIESDQPLIFEAKEMIADSAGAGRYRGAVGQRIVLRAQGEVLYSMLASKVDHAPRGLLGGGDGRPGRLLLNGKPLMPGDGILRPGDALTIETPGGAGLHPPTERPIEHVAADVQAGLVGLEVARSVYGVAFDAATLEPDHEESARLRANAGADR